MENNEIMNIEEMDVVEAGLGENGHSGMSTGKAMLAGAALTIAVAGVVKLSKRAWRKIKARKEARAAEGDFEEVYDEDDEVVVK